jgi:hypothetical protein
VEIFGEFSSSNPGKALELPGRPLDVAVLNMLDDPAMRS